MIIISDLDGTLASVDDRLHFLTDPGKKNFAAFHEAGTLAEPIPGTMRGLHQLLASRDHRLVIVTGREETYREATYLWLLKHSLSPIALFMRARGDYRPDIDYKGDIAKQFRPEDVLLVLEDRDRVVAMWRERGFTCWQVAHGTY